MGNKLLTYSAMLIGVYLVMAHATDAGALLNAAGTAGTGYAKTLQGR